MNRNRMTLAVAAIVLGSVALVGCKRDQPTTTVNTPPASAPAATTPAPAPTGTAPQGAVTVTSVDVGTAVGADSRVTSPTTTFSPSDTIYTSIATDGNASGNTIAIDLSHEGTSVHTDSRTLNTSGPSVTEFHVNNASGWPTGNYQVRVTVDGAAAQTRDFTVR